MSIARPLMSKTFDGTSILKNRQRGFDTAKISNNFLCFQNIQPHKPIIGLFPSRRTLLYAPKDGLPAGSRSDLHIAL